MNISSLQTLNTKYMRIAYAAILASILLLASLATIGLSVAQNNAPEGEWIIHDSQHPCIFNDNAGPDTAAYFWDADKDGDHDHLIGTDPPESVPSEIIACFGAEHFPVVSGEDLLVLETLCGTYGNSVQINREGRQETVSFGEWISLFRPDLLELFDEVGCAGEILEVTWFHEQIVKISETRLSDLAGVSSTRQLNHVITFTGDVSGDCFGDWNNINPNRAESEIVNFWWLISCQVTVEGKSGTIVIFAEGVFVRGASGRPDARTTIDMTWKIVGSGGDLANLSGEGTGEYSRLNDADGNGISVPPGPDCDRPDPGCRVFAGPFTGQLRLPGGFS